MKPVIVQVVVPNEAYEVIIGPGTIAEAGTRLAEVCTARTVALVSDTDVAGRFGARVASMIASAGFDVQSLSFEPGEPSKNWSVAGELLEAYAGLGLTREDCVVALGGGVVGDIAGFTAATYLRGISFAQIPTTLLAQVDSSVGGKTGVDLRAGKNLAGAFKQPLVVIADTDSLATLPESEWASGLAEVAKSAILESEEFLGWMERSVDALAVRESEVVVEAVRRCVAFKARVVARDEKEEGPRECLNYGHTLGHAIEKVAGYGEISHGRAVAEGMRFAARLAVEAGQADRSFVRRQDALLDALGLPTLETSCEASALLEAMHGDKKARGGVVRMVLPDGPGVWRCIPVEDAVISEHLAAWVESKGDTPVAEEPAPEATEGA